MKEDNTNTFRIHQYLNNRLTPKESQAIEQEIKNNPALKEEFKFQLNLKQASGELYKPELLKVVDEQFSKTGKPNNNRFLIPLLISLAALGILYFIFFKKSIPKSNQELFAEHINHYELANYRDSGNEHSLLFKAYQDKSYDLVCNEAKSWSTHNQPTLQKAYFVAGVSCLHANETDQAIRHLKVIPPSFIYFQDVQWYLALAHLKSDNIAAALKILESLKSNSIYEKRARVLIRLMK